jgi:hypothetical protein
MNPHLNLAGHYLYYSKVYRYRHMLVKGIENGTDPYV